MDEDRSSSSVLQDSVHLHIIAEKESFDKHKCIICQKDSKINVVSTENGRKRIQDAAQIRQDVVLKRLKMVDKDDNIMYHCNNSCYKSYTMTKSLQIIADKMDGNENEGATADVSENLSSVEYNLMRRSMSAPRPPPSQDDSENLKCVICGLVRKNKNRKKFRVCTSDRANMFLVAASFFKDEVFDRVADLDSDSNVFAADLYGHPNCMRAYLRKYERCSMEHHHNQPSEKYLLFQKANEIIAPLLEAGYGFTLTDIRELMVSFNGTAQIYNNEIKIFLVRTYNDRIRFCRSEKQNEPLLFFSSKLTPEVLASRIRSQESVKTAATVIRKALQEVNFNLKDKFCDALELKESWENTKMPEVLLTFFSHLFNISKTRLLHTKNVSDAIDSDDTENDENDGMDRKAAQLFCLFQIMYYELHHGQKKTPLHLMTGHAVYDKCKSKELISTMNKIGVSASYQDVIRSRNLLSSYAVLTSTINNTPLPSHFTKDGFTIAALDNFDFHDNSSLSGTCSTHDTALVLFQDSSSGAAPGKMVISETGIDKRSCKLVTALPCQEVKKCQKSVIRPSLPENFIVSENMEATFPGSSTLKAVDADFIISLIRCGIQEGGIHIPTWSGIHALISREKVPLSRVGFLPVIPSPVTDYATVYSALKNFQNIRVQLDSQPVLPVYCDEGVFHTVADIVLSRPEEFADLFPMMGAFHMTKVALRCAGKYITGSGMDDALIEAEIFGSKAVQSVLNGTHYARSFQGMIIIYEAIQTLQWNAFWARKNKSDYNEVFQNLKNMKDALIVRDEHKCQEVFDILNRKARILKKELDEFVKECCQKSELCSYWNLFLDIFLPARNLVAADRSADWRLHVESVESLLPIFRAFDCINYLRYGSWYLEQIKKLEIENPYLYDKFMQGHFVVKDKEGKFNSVSPDMKLEQTIQKSQKSSKGIVGQTRKSNYVAEWQLVYHEVLMICSMFRSLISADVVDQRETVHHHDLVGKKGEIFNENVSRLLNFMQHHGNPYEVTEPVRLHNFVTKQYVEDNVKDRLLGVLKRGTDLYQQLRQERFVYKSKKISHTISKDKLPQFSTNVESKPTTVLINFSKKLLSQAHKELEMAKERGDSIEQILEHDLLPTNTLFDKDSPTKPAKHVLVTQIEKNLSQEQVEFQANSHLKTAVIVDFMSQVRMLKISSMKLFGEAINAVIRVSSSVCSLQELHMIFDSYLPLSVKESERLRRQSTSGTIDLAMIETDTPIPVQLEKFWASTLNKTNLQKLARKVLEKQSGKFSFPVIASGTVANGELDPALLFSKEERQVIEELASNLEEADLRIVPHVDWTIRNGAKRVVVLSNDTDVVILLLRYVCHWISQGLSQLWVRFGTGKNRRFIPVHELFKKLGPEMSRVLIKAHILTGNDELSKIGTKVGAISADPTKYLSDFGESSVDDDYEKVEKYLVRVWKPHSSCETFDALRFSEYRRSVPISELPPTSHSISGHILRALYLIRRSIYLLANVYPQTDPCNFGWEILDEVLRPKKFLKFLPSELLCVCNCKVCSTNICRCRKAIVKCTHFCKCSDKDCKNPY